MVKKLACGMVAGLAMACAAHAEEEKQVQAPVAAAEAAKEPLKLSDAELDEITAGVTVVLFTPGNSVSSIGPNRTILITGGSPSTFGFVATPNGKFITIPGGN
jgi:hypothetical protein